MKITCDCGNEMEFISSEYKYEEDPYIDEDELGQYVKYDENKFRFWKMDSDEQGIACNKCNNRIWFY